MNDEEVDVPLGDIDTPEGVFNAGNRRAVKDMAQQAKLRELGKTEALRALLDARYGRALVYDLLKAAGMWSEAVGSTWNSNELWHRIGQRKVAVDLHAAAWRANRQGCKLMMDENTE